MDSQDRAILSFIYKRVLCSYHVLAGRQALGGLVMGSILKLCHRPRAGTNGKRKYQPCCRKRKGKLREMVEC